MLLLDDRGGIVWHMEDLFWSRPWITNVLVTMDIYKSNSHINKNEHKQVPNSQRCQRALDVL